MIPEVDALAGAQPSGGCVALPCLSALGGQVKRVRYLLAAARRCGTRTPSLPRTNKGENGGIS